MGENVNLTEELAMPKKLGPIEWKHIHYEIVSGLILNFLLHGATVKYVWAGCRLPL